MLVMTMAAYERLFQLTSDADDGSGGGGGSNKEPRALTQREQEKLRATTAFAVGVSGGRRTFGCAIIYT